MKQFIFSFDDKKISKLKNKKNLLGGKGANLAEMGKLGLPVPPGFTITTEVCDIFYSNKKKLPTKILSQIKAEIKKIEKKTSKKFGDLKNPLLVSVRSGARISMPGMMDTILNLGLNDKTVNALASKSNNRKMGQFQDLDHLDGLSVSSVSANLYNSKRDDLAMFYFRQGANYASVYTQSKIVSENIKWNIKQRPKKIFSLIVNTRNANTFTGKQGYEGLKKIADLTAKELNKKQQEDEENPKKISSKNIIFGCTGTIGEIFPSEKISEYCYCEENYKYLFCFTPSNP